VAQGAVRWCSRAPGPALCCSAGRMCWPRSSKLPSCSA
jgi:hypothetical protein